MTSIHHMPRVAFAQYCQLETQSNFFSHTILTWISAIHLKLKFKINGVDESKTEHDMTGYSGTITHSKSTVIIQDEEPIYRWELYRKDLISLTSSHKSLHSSVFTSETKFRSWTHGFPFMPPPPVFTLPHLFSLHFFNLKRLILYLTLSNSHNLTLYKVKTVSPNPNYKP